MKNNELPKAGIGVVMLMSFALVAGCGGSTSPSVEEAWNQPWEVSVEGATLDTVATGDEDLLESMLADREADGETQPIVDRPPVSESRPEASRPAGARPDPRAFTPGWRVQIFASSSMVSADELAAQARRRFSEMVYVEYEPPLYKVRVGDFLTKPAAKQMAARVQAEEFDAWVVETLVVRPN